VVGEKKALKLGMKREREAWGGLYRSSGLYHEGNRTKHHHGHDTQRIREIHTRIEGQRSHGWCDRTMGAPTPLGPPPGL